MSEINMNEIINDVNQKVSAIGSEVPPPTKPKSDFDLNPIILIIIVLMASCFTCGVIYWKKTRTIEVANVEKPSLTMTQIQEEIQPLIDSTNEKIDQLSQRVDVISKRQWLLGLANNENSYISQNIASKVDPTFNQKYIILNEQWKLNKSPEYLKMRDDDRKRLIYSLVK